MAKKKSKKPKQEKLIPVAGLIFIVLLLVVLPLCLMNLKFPKKTQEPPAQTEPSSPIQIFQNKNPYKPEDFVMKDGFMTCLATDGVPGIDVSSYQGEIDWQQVRQAGVEFAFVRIGFRRSKDGTLGEDEMGKINLQGASEAGIKVGAYFFSQATCEEEAREEAEYALELLQGYPLDLPLAYDWERVNDRTDGMTRRVMMQCVEAFCSTVEAAGYETLVYFNGEMAKTLLNVNKLNDRPAWFAMYADYPDAPCKPDYWQYSDKGKIPGIEGNVDLNIYLP